MSISIAMVATCVALLIAASSASAAYKVLDFKVTPSTKQAGGHPKLHYHVDPDAVNADTTGGDDLKKVVIDYAAGLLGNPEAAAPKCGDSDFNGDVCPAGSYIGSMVVKWREAGGLIKSAPGSVYLLASTSPGSAATVGFIVRPPTGWRKVYLKTEVTGVVTVRSGTEADYGLTITIDNIPRTLTATSGAVKNITISDIAADINARAGATQNGKYFTFNPTRCTSANSRATITSYSGITVMRNNAFTPTGCSSVPFNPTASVTATDLTAGRSTGVSATFTMPTADATIQSSHVQGIQVDLPDGTLLDFPAIGAVPATCTDAELNADICSAGAKIGDVSASVPFLPPTMTGDVYLMQRSSSIVFGYVLRGANGVKAMLKGQVAAVDLNGDGAADRVRATTGNMPQAPWSSATINFTAKLIKNPTACKAAATSSKLTGWSGAVVTRTAPWGTMSCLPDDVVPPVVTITSPADGSYTAASTATLSYTATDDSGVVPTCSPAGGVAIALLPGPNVLTVSCSDGAGNTASKSVTVFRDNMPPTISNLQCPGASGGATTCTITYTATDNSGVPPVCTPPSGSTINLVIGTNTITVNCVDLAGNVGSASLTVVPPDVPPPLVTITSPVNGSTVYGPSTTVSYVAVGYTGLPLTCNIANGSSVALAMGANTITVTCADSRGNVGSATVTVFRNDLPPPYIVQPVNGTHTTASTVTLVYTTSSYWTCDKANNSVIPLVAGFNVITLTCTDLAGNAASGSVTVVRDNIPPVVTITSPANGLVTTISPVTLNYVATDNASTPVCNRANGSSVPLFSGSNTITVTCTDSAGNSASASVTVFYERPIPVVVITSPANNTATQASSVTLTFTVTVASGTATCDRTSGSSVPLVAGNNTITVNCADSGGNVSTASVSVYRDNTPPAITGLQCPGLGTAALSCTVSYVATDNSPFALTCAPPSGSTVALTTRPSSLSVTCTDRAGNVGTATLTSTPDVTPPQITITSPVSGSSTTSPSVVVIYTATDNSGAVPTCTIASGSNVALVLGVNMITVNCVDSSGNVASASVTVTRNSGGDDMPPLVSITSPANGTVTTASSVLLTYTATDNSGVAPPCSVSNNSTVSLVAGNNTITVSCSDPSGNVGFASVSVFRDNTFPVVTITSPANGTVTQAGSIAVSYTATDNHSIAGCTPANGSSVPLAVGLNTITVTCTDSAGNSRSTSVSVTRNTLSGPTVTINNGPADGSTITTNRATFTYQSSEPLWQPYPCAPGTTCIQIVVDMASYSCNVDGGSYTNCSFQTPGPYPSYTTPALANGLHTFCVRTTNQSGQTSVPACRAFTVAVPPEPVIPTNQP